MTNAIIYWSQSVEGGTGTLTAREARESLDGTVVWQNATGSLSVTL
jgi:hypothetical protein